MAGKFYAVGLGPGDKNLITYKAVEILSKSDIVFVPDSGSKEQVAYDIVKEYIPENKILSQSMPMIRDLDLLDKQHTKVSELMISYLEKGKTISFANLGDPTIYGSVMYIHKRLKEQGYLTEIIPGIPSFCAASAALNISLCERGEAMHIIPASYGNLDEVLNLDGVKILMKTGHSYKETLQKIKDKSLDAQVVSRASMAGEEKYYSLEEAQNALGYFTIILIR